MKNKKKVIKRRQFLRLSRYFLLLPFLLSIFLCINPTFGESKTANDDNFNEIKTTSFTIFYEPDVNLKTIRSKLNRRRFYISGSKKPGKLDSVEEKISYRLNMLFARVKETLDMYPINIHCKVKIFKSRKKVQNEFKKYANRKAKVKSFYLHRYKTIYMSQDDISDSVMAHEMAHFIIDHYFMIRPPEKVNEMLAIYADSHLD